MANICDFTMHLTGEKENILQFYHALCAENTDIWIGIGAVNTELTFDSPTTAHIIGQCDWSIQISLIDNAVIMQKMKHKNQCDSYGLNHVNNVVTLFEACKLYNVNMEVKSKECGFQFQEHMKYQDGIITDEVLDYVSDINDTEKENYIDYSELFELE